MTNKNPEPYDSTADTQLHIARVGQLLELFSRMILSRVEVHDASKLRSPEKESFDVLTPLLAATTYGSDDYKKILREHKPALDHHYAHNAHHPEHYKDGVAGMTLIDVIEMYCDWKAASQRHDDGDFGESLKHNAGRFKLDAQLVAVFENTRNELGW